MEKLVYIYFLLSVQSQNLSCQCLAAIYNARDKRENSIIFRSSPCLTALFFPLLPYLSSLHYFFFFCCICIFSNSHTLNIHRSTPHPTSCLLFTPLNSYSVCFIILHTRTSRSLVSYSWNNVLTGGYTVCIFTALMYVQFAFICKYNGYSIKTRDDNNH